MVRKGRPEGRLFHVRGLGRGMLRIETFFKFLL